VEVKDAEPDEETQRLLHKTIKKVTEDIESFGFNTAISAMMIFINHLAKQQVKPKALLEKFVLILSPFAPHITEELWEKLGHKEALACEPWPQFDEKLVQDKQVELAVQVNGRIKERIVVSAGADEDQIKQKALSCEKVVTAIAGREPRKIFVVKERLVNIVC
jgi:leucyl-tRNA synthetase